LLSNPKPKGGNFYFPSVNFPLFPFGEGGGGYAKENYHKNEKLKFSFFIKKTTTTLVLSSNRDWSELA